MSVLPSAENTWVPSKQFMAAVRDCYFNGQPIDLTKFNAEDWTQAVAYSESTEKLRRLIESNTVSEFIYDLWNAGVEIDLESLCSFGNLSFVIDSKMYDAKELNSAITFIIENKISMNQMRWPHCSKNGPVDVNFKDILEAFSYRWFEDWRSRDSIDAGALLVSLCDYLGVKVEPIAESPKEWNIEEYQFAEYPRENKESLKKFARLFSKPMNTWYSQEWCD
jgi:hypothetical protein